MPTKGKKEKEKAGGKTYLFCCKRTNEAAVRTVHCEPNKAVHPHTLFKRQSSPLIGKGSAVVSRRWWHILPLEFNLGNLSEGTLWLVLAPRS